MFVDQPIYRERKIHQVISDNEQIYFDLNDFSLEKKINCIESN